MHSVVFHTHDEAGKPLWNASDAMLWLHDHGYAPIKLHFTPESLRFRIVNPKKFGSFVTKIIHTRKNPYRWSLDFRSESVM